MKWLTSQYNDVENILMDNIPRYWPGLKTISKSWFLDSVPSELILPIAACKAVGGIEKNANSIAAATVASAIGLRILDNLQDEDKLDGIWDQIGKPRAWNYAFAFKEIAYRIVHSSGYPSHLITRVLEVMNDGFIHIAAGQDRDLAGSTITIEDYVDTINMKTGSAYSTATALGAIIGTNVPNHIQSCGNFGYNVGRAVQIFNDFESIWGGNDSLSDVEKGRTTLPILIGLTDSSPIKKKLAEEIGAGDGVHDLAKIRGILDETNIREEMINIALIEREEGLKILRTLPNKEGVNALESYFTGMFGDIGALIHTHP